MQSLVYEDSSRGTTLQLALVQSEPLAYIMQSCWSTHLMNFATSEAMYSLFPVSALQERQMGIVSLREFEAREACDKYVDRGFTGLSLDRLPPLGEFRNDRVVGDEWTRRVAFDNDSAQADELVIQWRFRVAKHGIECYGSISSDDV